MYAIISEIDSQSSQKVSKLWQTLNQTCGLEAIYTIPTPHFTWLVAEDLDIAPVKSKLFALQQQRLRLNTHTFGLGIFAGGSPVLYLPLVKSLEMIHLHEKIWDDLLPFCKDVNLYYSPPMWLPHITLALKDLNRKNLACAVNQMAFEPIELSITMKSLAIATHEDEKIGKILHRFLVEE
jgi:hypothetical protein